MTRILPVVSVTLLLVGCSRSGHHPEPIAPQNTRSPYDIEAHAIRVYQTGVQRQKSGLKDPQVTLNIADSIAARVRIYLRNVGQAVLPEGSMHYKVTINDTRFSTDGGYGNSTPKKQEKFLIITMPVKTILRTYKLNKPGRYEVVLRVWLDEELGETNLDNNELIHFFHVEE